VGDRPVCTAATVYVAVETTGWTKVPVPDVLLAALGPVGPLPLSPADPPDPDVDRSRPA
jgi:hypothetical protein